MARRNDDSEDRNEPEDEYEEEMNALEEEEVANRPNFTADDLGDDYNSYEPPPRRRDEFTPRRSSPVTPRRSSSVSNPNSPDFENFDPAAYIRNRRAVSGERPLPSERDPYRESARRQVYEERRREEDEGEVPIAAVGGLGRYLTPETMPMLSGLADQLGPLFRWVVYGFGCLLIFALIGCGVVVYTIVTAFRR